MSYTQIHKALSLVPFAGMLLGRSYILWKELAIADVMEVYLMVTLEYGRTLDLVYWQSCHTRLMRTQAIACYPLPTAAPNIYTENDPIAKYEIMDGAPVRGESIPIRLFLAGYDLTPTMRDINKKFSVRYYLNLVLVDEEERRYFKQQVSKDWMCDTLG